MSTTNLRNIDIDSLSLFELESLAVKCNINLSYINREYNDITVIQLRHLLRKIKSEQIYEIKDTYQLYYS